MKNSHHKIIVVSFFGFLFLWMVLGIGLPDQEISFAERRKLSIFPKFEWNDLWSGRFFADVDEYLVDQFPFRESFRQMKGWVSTEVFGQKESHGVFVQDQVLYDLDHHLNLASVEHFSQLLMRVEQQYLQENPIYYAVIPDKNYYLSDPSIPKLDYQTLEETLEKQFPTRYRKIDLKDCLGLSSYYRTDIHWRQEMLAPVVERLQNEMLLERTVFPNQKENYFPFYGALYGRIASKVQPDTLVYLRDSIISDAMVYQYEKQKTTDVYVPDDLSHVDSYDVFLAGATPLLEIQNPNQESGRELILFRDSFGSSLAPLLIANYSKITVIDLRYFSSSLLETIPLSSDADVLFLYSVPIINNSFSLK